MSSRTRQKTKRKILHGEGANENNTKKESKCSKGKKESPRLEDNLVEKYKVSQHVAEEENLLPCLKKAKKTKHIGNLAQHEDSDTEG